jgi:uncharacterized membrane protein YfcA
MANIQLVGTFLIGIIAGFMSAVGGGGSLISVPFLLFLGIPPQVTLATNKFAGVGACYTGLTKYIKEKKVVWKYTIFLAIMGSLASLIGTRILVKIDTASLNNLIGVLLIILVPTLFIKKDLGLKHIQISKERRLAGYFVYFLLSIIASFFGGVGLLMVPTVVFFFGLPFIEANATDYFSFAVMSTVAVIIYFSNHLINLEIGVVLFAGMAIGGYLGAHTAIKKGNEWVKVFYAIVIIVSAIKILLGR